MKTLYFVTYYNSQGETVGSAGNFASFEDAVDHADTVIHGVSWYYRIRLAATCE